MLCGHENNSHILQAVTLSCALFPIWDVHGEWLYRGKPHHVFIAPPNADIGTIFYSNTKAQDMITYNYTTFLTKCRGWSLVHHGTARILPTTGGNQFAVRTEWRYSCGPVWPIRNFILAFVAVALCGLVLLTDCSGDSPLKGAAII